VIFLPFFGGSSKRKESVRRLPHKSHRSYKFHPSSHTRSVPVDPSAKRRVSTPTGLFALAFASLNHRQFRIVENAPLGVTKYDRFRQHVCSAAIGFEGIEK
jgi:hypothetical protein